MIPKKTTHSQGRLFQSRLSQILDPTNELFQLAEDIDWESLEKSLSWLISHTRGVSC